MQVKNVMTIADITSIDGKFIKPDALSPVNMQRMMSNPNAPRDPPRWELKWNLWRESLAPLYSDNLRLLTPLSDWFLSEDDIGNWQWWFSPLYGGNSRLYKKERHCWIEYRSSNFSTTRHRGRFYPEKGICSQVPSNIEMADIKEIRPPHASPYFLLIGHTKNKCQDRTHPPLSIQQVFDSLPQTLNGQSRTSL